MPSSPRPALSHPIPPHPVLSASSDSSDHASQRGPTSPNCGCPSHLALAPLMQCPQELSRPWRIAGERRRAQSLSTGGRAALLAPRLSLATASPRPTSLWRRGSRDDLPAARGEASEMSQRSHSHEPPGPDERPFFRAGQRKKPKRWRKFRAGRGMGQTRMQEDSKTMGRQRRRKDRGGAEDLNLPAAKSRDGSPLALGVDTVGSLRVRTPRPIHQLLSSQRLEAWRCLSPGVRRSALEAKEPASCPGGSQSGSPCHAQSCDSVASGWHGAATPGGLPSLEAGPGALLRATHSSDGTYGSRMTMGGVGGRSLPSAMICSKVMSV